MLKAVAILKSPVFLLTAAIVLKVAVAGYLIHAARGGSRWVPCGYPNKKALTGFFRKGLFFLVGHR